MGGYCGTFTGRVPSFAPLIDPCFLQAVETDQNPKAKAPATRMPNPKIAKTVASYAGN
jgi:hypothetical protein